MSDVNQALGALSQVDGFLGAAVVDSSSGMVLGKLGSGINLDVAAAGNTEVVKSKLKTMKALSLPDHIDDILITLTTQYHIIRPVAKKLGLFIYLAVHKDRANLAMSRYKVQEIENDLTI